MPNGSAQLWLWSVHFLYAQYSTLAVISAIGSLYALYTADCGHYVPCMPNMHLWLWSVWCSLYAQYTSLIVISVMLPVCPIHFSDCDQCDVSCMPKANLCLWSVWCSLAIPSMQLWLWSVCFLYAQCTALVVVSALCPVCLVHSSDCSQYVSCMPNAQLWL